MDMLEDMYIISCYNKGNVSCLEEGKQKEGEGKNKKLNPQLTQTVIV